MAIPINFELESPAWLRNLRWVTIFGLSLAVLAGSAAGIELKIIPIVALLLALAAWNLLLPKIEQMIPVSLQAFLCVQVVVDFCALTFLLWGSGGLMNPFVEFFLFHVMVAGLLLSPVLTLTTAAVASVCVVILAFAPPLVVQGKVFALRSSPVWPAFPAGMILMIAVTTAFILIFLHRLGKAQDEARFHLKMEALGRLVAGLAHEIGTPLNSILLLARESIAEAPAALKKDLTMIASEAKRCGDIVSLLLGYSHTLVRSSEDIQYSSVEIRKWLQDIYESVLREERKKSPMKQAVEFSLQVYDLPEKVRVPELVLRQVFENLLKNALYAVKNESDAQIVVQIHQDLIEGNLVFEVADNGPGFTEEGKERAFEAFFSTKTQELSSGLGLYMSYYLLEHVCGRIVVADHSGRGAILRVTLPRFEAFDDQAASA